MPVFYQLLAYYNDIKHLQRHYNSTIAQFEISAIRRGKNIDPNFRCYLLR